MKTLPKKMSTLLRLAVEDAKKAEQTPGYKLDMAYWHAPNNMSGVCTVCMAGAVMGVSLGISPKNAIELEWFHEDDKIGRYDEQTSETISGNLGQLHAINAMRMGIFNHAADDVGIEIPMYVANAAKRCLDERDYEEGRFPWEQYLAAADELERHGF